MSITKITLTAFSLSLVALGANASAQTQINYLTGFESTGDPSGVAYNAGDLNGQDDWVVDMGSANVVANSAPVAPAVSEIATNSNVVRQDINTSIKRDIPANSTQTILFRGFYYGAGVEDLDPPGSTPAMAAALGFRKLDDSTLQIEGHDGTNFIAPNANPAPAALSNSEWHKIIIRLDYTTKIYSVSVDNTPYLVDIPFSNDTVTGLNGFKSSTQVGASIDTIGFFDTEGDFDGDGMTDAQEMMTAGADPLDPNLPVPPTTPTPSPTNTPEPSPSISPSNTPTPSATPTVATPTVATPTLGTPTSTTPTVATPSVATPTVATPTTVLPTNTPEPTATVAPTTTVEPTSTTVAPTATATPTPASAVDVVLDRADPDPDGGSDKNNDDIVDAADIVAPE